MSTRPALAPTASRAVEPPPLTSRDQVLGVAFGLWMVTGLFLDGWAHDNNKPESFFTPWHGVLYSGFLAAAISAFLVARRGHRPGEPLRRTLPRGHGLTLVALAAFAGGAVGDLVWHEVLGIEIGVEALLSPTHLVLLAAGLIALSAPLRAAWMSAEDEPASLRAFLPTVLSLAVLVALVGFFVLYLSPFLNDAAGTRFVRLPGVTHEHPSTDVGELQQLLGVASILITTVLLVVPIQLLLRRWRPPTGSFTVFVGVVVLLFVGLNEFRQAALVIAGLAAGASADLAVRRVPAALTGTVATTVLWLSYFGLYSLTEGEVAWTAELWAGTTFLAALISAGIGLLSAPLPRLRPSSA